MENDKKKNYLLRDIPPELWHRAKHVAVDEELSLRDLLLRAIDQYCNERTSSKRGKEEIS